MEKVEEKQLKLFLEEIYVAHFSAKKTSKKLASVPFEEIIFPFTLQKSETHRVYIIPI